MTLAPIGDQRIGIDLNSLLEGDESFIITLELTQGIAFAGIDRDISIIEFEGRVISLQSFFIAVEAAHSIAFVIIEMSFFGVELNGAFMDLERFGIAMQVVKSKSLI